MFSSSYFSSDFFSASYWSGVSAAVAASTGGGDAVRLGPSAGWRQITDDELRASARRADRRRRAEEKRRRRKKAEPAPPASILPAPAPASSPEVDRLIDVIAFPGVEDVGERMRSRELAAALARAREAAELLRTERRAVVGKLARRAVVRPATRRAGALGRDILKADSRMLVREEERRDEVCVDRRSIVTCLTRLR